jgi:putative phosphoesterase
MKITVIADTHVQHFNQLPQDIIKSLKEADAVIHLGDFDSMEILREFQKFNNFFGVSGNHDKGELKTALPETDIVEVKGKKLGIVHGHGCVLPLGFQYGLLQRFNGNKVDAILFGHTHIAVSKNIDDILFFNPGSTAGRFPAEQKSYGILEIGNDIKSYIVPLKTTYKSNLINQAYSIAQEFSPRELYYRVTTLY